MNAWINHKANAPILFGLMGLALVLVGVMQSWSLALTIMIYCVIGAIMALGLNVQWGYAGLFNVGLMGFAALGGIAAVLVSMPPTPEAWQAGGSGIITSVLLSLATLLVALLVYKRMKRGRARMWAMAVILLGGYFITRHFFDPAVELIEAVNPAATGYLGGLGLPIMLSWVVGGLFAAGAAWMIGKITLGLRSDYLAIATLGIAEIILSLLRFEEWLTRGVNNVNGLPRPLPQEIDLQQTAWLQEWALRLSIEVPDLASYIVKLGYLGLALGVLLLLFWLAQTAIHSPWGRMMRAIRDNETAAEAMGKDVTGRHLQVFVLGSAIVGVAGAMLVTIDGQFTPNAYNPLRFTFLIWVMVIVGGSGNNMGAILGGFLIWFFWVQAEPIGLWLMDLITGTLPAESWLRAHLLEGAAHIRLMVMGMILLLVLRFRPHGLIPERSERPHSLRR